ncbi:CIC11C00000004046 [Sungouiella intermedia]|uniref:Restriction of telomere capping protein 1 n=1 Tax=Sungouiella intermedia TaxID=45354 RepID=A0A1L0C1T4_9ASCO|nr:CIC11C00000004046 [[Candida] intermedia]
MASGPNQSQLSLARFAFNIYGSLGSNDQPRGKSPDPLKPSLPRRKKLMYSCEREITCLSRLKHPMGRLSASFDPSTSAPIHHVVIGGKNYLKLLALNNDQSEVVADVNIVEPPGLSRLHSSTKLFNVNTVKCYGDMIACGLTSGSVHVHQVSGNGKSRLAYKLEDHKRVVNSVDFTDHEQVLFSGSQDGTVKLWDLRTFSPKPVLKLSASQHSDPVRSCEYSRHSKVRGKMTVLSVHDSGLLCKFDLRYPGSNSSSTVLPERKWTFHTGPALSLHIHPESEYVLTGGRDKKICVWNYGENSLHPNSPEMILNTYGPVMKIRWSQIPCHDRPHGASNFEFGEDDHDPKLSLYDYDFACLFLNDDPTITVFNLRRKHVPKEIVTTTTLKPFQNFIWAGDSSSTERKLWTLTKSNMFVSYNLTTGDDGLLNVTRPLDDLPSIVTTWQNGFADLSIVTQDSRDYGFQGPEQVEVESDILDRTNLDEFTRIDEEHTLEQRSSSITLDNSNIYSKTPMGSLPNPSNLLYQKTQNNSPKDRPQLIRLSTAYTPTKSPSPVPFGRPNVVDNYGSVMRPSLPRNPSQSTQDSESPLFMSLVATSKKSPFSGPSPYVVGVSVPIPLGDEAVFEVLANEYYTSVPDGFALADVCQMNARLAASVQRYRDCQVWRLLAVALEQEENSFFDDYTHNERVVVEAESTLNQSAAANDDAKSISSDLDNFVGSYNSNSTLTTNYGSVPKGSEVASSLHNTSLLGSSASSRLGGSLMGYKSGSTASIDQFQSGHLSGPSTASRANSLLMKRRPSLPAPKMITPSTEQEHAIVDDDEDDVLSEASNLPNKEHHISKTIPRKSSAIDIRSTKYLSFGAQTSASPEFFNEEGSPLMYSRKNSVKKYTAASFSTTQHPWAIPNSSQDLDNENLNILTAASYSTSAMHTGSGHTVNSGIRSRPSMGSLKGSPIMTASYAGRGSFAGGRSGALGIKQTSPQHLERVVEANGNEHPRKSALTSAFKEKDKEDEDSEVLFSDKPWNTMGMLKRAIDYAMDQGDIIMCSTLILLFYELLHKYFPKKVLSKEGCLECLGMYIETLRKRQLFTNAVKVVKDAPTDLLYELSNYANKDVDLRFYCCWCNKLMLNEASKAKHGAGSDKFGFWYCDNCRRKQLNCIYCNEPCKGLTVVVSLKCGHRGHFGCLQEWFIIDQNTECPGGCEDSVMA